MKAATLARWRATRLPWLGSRPAGQLYDRQRGDLGKSDGENLGTYGFAGPSTVWGKNIQKYGKIVIYSGFPMKNGDFP